MIKCGHEKMWVKPGEKFCTVSGMITTPIPKAAKKPLTDRKVANEIKRLDQWMIDNAIADVKHRNDDWNLFLFERMIVNQLSPADKDFLELYLFNDDGWMHNQQFEQASCSTARLTLPYEDL